MNRITRFLARPAALAVTGLALAFGLNACTTANVGVSSDFDHAVNFRAYKTWAWYPKQTNDTEGGPAKGYESFTDQRIRDAVTKDLAAKSLTEVASNASPDVYVAYSVRVENKQQVASPYGYGGYPYGYGYGGFGGYGYPYGGGGYNYKAGTVIIDIVDAKRKELAWRGTGQAQLDKNTITEEETYRIVNSVLGNYPPTDNRQRQAYR
ncbi:MAG: DUF4136 domain-containing protein [Hymenobacter sp.]|nr:MAG: DUF4136 domain-containing protein [Hymenobacter sp.]